MQKAACGAVVVMACALVVPLVLPMTAEASGPTLTLIGARLVPSGAPSPTNSWDVADCSAAGVTAGDTVILVWGNPLSSEQIGLIVVTVGAAGGNCTGTLGGRVPGDATVGDHDVSTAYLQETSGPIGGSEATASRAFVVTPGP